MGVTVRNSFLEQFDAARTRWVILIPGRAAVLKLRGPRGHLDIVAVYFPTGEVLEGDASLLADLGPLPRTTRSLREVMRRHVARALLPPEETLTVVGGTSIG